MPPRFAVISDGSCDFSREEADRLSVTLVPFYVSFDDKTYRREGVDVEVRDFYQEMVEHPGVYPKSSMPSVDDYIQVFRPLAAAGTPALCVCITTKFSGSYNCASTAAGLLREEYPDWELRVMDSRVNTVLQGEVVREAVRLRDEGCGLEEACRRLEAVIPTGRIIFTIGSMDYLKMGGRIGKVASVVTGALGIKPLIVLKEGEIFPAGIFRSREKGKARLVELTRRHLASCGEDVSHYRFVIGYGYDRAEAEAFRDDMLAMLREVCGLTSLGVFQIGATIGVHTGPHPIGIGLLRRA